MNICPRCGGSIRKDEISLGSVDYWCETNDSCRFNLQLATGFSFTYFRLNEYVFETYYDSIDPDGSTIVFKLGKEIIEIGKPIDYNKSNQEILEDLDKYLKYGNF